MAAQMKADDRNPNNVPRDDAARVETEGSGVDEAFRQVQAERDQAVAARQRALADFANYQRRALDNEMRARQQGVSSVVRAVLPVLDHFDLALEQDVGGATAERFIGGMGMVREELMKALLAQGVQRIDPAVGDEFQPGPHEAVMQQEALGIEPNRVAAVMQPGYALGEQVIRPAKVAVTPGATD